MDPSLFSLPLPLPLLCMAAFEWDFGPWSACSPCVCVQMVDMALETVRSGGHVLIPVDTAGRVLELLLRLDEKWDDRFPLVFVNAVGSSTVGLAVGAHSCPCQPSKCPTFDFAQFARLLPVLLWGDDMPSLFGAFWLRWARKLPREQTPLKPWHGADASHARSPYPVTLSLPRFCPPVQLQLEFAKTQVEWMSSKMSKQLDMSRTKPFAFRCVQVVRDISSLRFDVPMVRPCALCAPVTVMCSNTHTPILPLAHTASCQACVCAWWAC